MLGFALGVAGCAGGSQTTSNQGLEGERLPSAAFTRHMHIHADQLDNLNFALADDDLYGAMTPAYWLSRHDEISGAPASWQPYLTGMRKAAFQVESATDLATARAAAKKIGEQCQGCHAATGVR